MSSRTPLTGNYSFLQTISSSSGEKRKRNEEETEKRGLEKQSRNAEFVSQNICTFSMPQVPTFSSPSVSNSSSGFSRLNSLAFFVVSSEISSSFSSSASSSEKVTKLWKNHQNLQKNFQSALRSIYNAENYCNYGQFNQAIACCNYGLEQHCNNDQIIQRLLQIKQSSESALLHYHISRAQRSFAAKLFDQAINHSKKALNFEKKIPNRINIIGIIIHCYAKKATSKQDFFKNYVKHIKDLSFAALHEVEKAYILYSILFFYHASVKCCYDEYPTFFDEAKQIFEKALEISQKTKMNLEFQHGLYFYYTNILHHHATNSAKSIE